MKTILSTLGFLVLSISLLAQTPMLKGKVIDQATGEAMPFANVLWCDGKTGAVTDMEGDFILADTTHCDSLKVMMVGYDLMMVFVPEGSKDITIEMNSSVTTLDAVIIATDKPARYEDVEMSMSYSRVESREYEHSYRKSKDAKGYADAPVGGVYSDEGSGEKAGQLTSGEVNDFSKWALWEDIDKTDLATYNKQWQFYPENRYVVQVTNSKKLPVHNATAVLMDEMGSVVWSAKTDNTGKAELWAGMFTGKVDKKYSINVIYDNKSYPVKKADSFANGINFVEIPVACSQEKNVDVAFMIDATGSMGDEIRYLQSELSDVMTQIKDSLPGFNIRLAIVFYRDLGDNFVVIQKDFTSNIPDAINYLQTTGAGGGGDYPEAVDSALEVSINQLSWSNDAVARILFPVLDAPPHAESSNIASLHKSIPIAASKGIRIVPLACSGVNKSTEYMLRSFALATNGTYVFLTDHSGIGNPHIAPTTDDYKVELLNEALVRIIISFSKSPECDPAKPENTNQHDTAVASLPIPRDTAKIQDSTPIADSLKTDTNIVAPLPEISWRYYPNPTAGPLTVEIVNLPEGENGFLYLTDLNGKLLRRYEVKENNTFSVDISEFPTGTYYLTYFYGTESKLCAPVVLLH